MQLAFGAGALWGNRTDVTGAGVGPDQFGILQERAGPSPGRRAPTRWRGSAASRLNRRAVQLYQAGCERLALGGVGPQPSSHRTFWRPRAPGRGTPDAASSTAAAGPSRRGCTVPATGRYRALAEPPP